MLKLNWRRITKVILRLIYAQIIIHKLKPIKSVSINIHWKLKTAKIINISSLKLQNEEYSITEWNFHHLLHAHNVFCNGLTTREICGAHVQMALNHLHAVNQVNLDFCHSTEIFRPWFKTPRNWICWLSWILLDLTWNFLVIHHRNLPKLCWCGHYIEYGWYSTFVHRKEQSILIVLQRLPCSR